MWGGLAPGPYILVVSAGMIRVAIIEDQRNIRESLRVLIDGANGLQCGGVFANMEEALADMDRNLPDVALVDIGLPGMSGIQGIAKIRERFPAVLPLVLTVYNDDERIFQALCAGACGYLLKKTPPSRLLDCLTEAVAGGAPMSPEVARQVVTLFQRFRPPIQDHQLTPHEVRLLKLLVDGENYKTASAMLGVSINTVAFHMRNIYQKLQVHSKSEAVARALRSGIV
jgi:DNA-binding NarL/FixJ family response regulator